MHADHALILVHDPAPDRKERIPGAILPSLAACGVGFEVASFAGLEPHAERPQLADSTLLIVMGSHESAYDNGVPWLAAELALVAEAIGRGTPVLGICFGAQLLARSLGGTVSPSSRPERGFTHVESRDSDLVPERAWMQLHQDVFTVPASAREIARNTTGPQAFTHGMHLGVQFHPEITSDSFESWIERWYSSGAIERFRRTGIDLDALRTDIAQREAENAEACSQLIGTFYRRACAFRDGA